MICNASQNANYERDVPAYVNYAVCDSTQMLVVQASQGLENHLAPGVHLDEHSSLCARSDNNLLRDSKLRCRTFVLNVRIPSWNGVLFRTLVSQLLLDRDGLAVWKDSEPSPDLEVLDVIIDILGSQYGVSP